MLGQYVNLHLRKRKKEKILREESEKLIDECRLERDRVWSILGHQVVGAEVF